MSPAICTDKSMRSAISSVYVQASSSMKTDEKFAAHLRQRPPCPISSTNTTHRSSKQEICQSKSVSCRRCNFLPNRVRIQSCATWPYTIYHLYCRYRTNEVFACANMICLNPPQLVVFDDHDIDHISSRRLS